ncbi:hypothetical protein JRQ81_009845 [Phrynocephalus forsythii]|uniref:Uncharacterized protein n=1 Tax=Phrynocephalus forsythii TaxID=171643 RepID=A0A9Q1ARI0_9SAUR|nr:hypothetical protein JRQ81_009845 [Phrynocephalus forsythii]
MCPTERLFFLCWALQLVALQPHAGPTLLVPSSPVLQYETLRDMSPLCDLPAMRTRLRSCENRCKSILLPGNSTSDNVCRELQGPIGGATLSPHKTGNGMLPSQHSFTKAPALDVKNGLSADVSSIAGWAAGAMFAMFALICGTLLCFAFRNKGQPCASLCGTEKQPFPATEKLPGTRPRDANSLCQEDQNLLDTSTSSTSGSLDHLQASEKSSRVGEASTPNIEPEGLQQRAPLLDSCVSHSTADSKQSSSGRTHVNVSCVVNVCRSDHNAPIRSLSSSVPAVPPGDGRSTEDDLPLSKEESPVKKEPGGQIAVEVEDDVDLFYFHEGKLLPLSSQEGGMETA